jgi:xanthine dehydrogenase accessory factor
MNDHQLVRAALDAVDRGEPVVVATVVETERSVPRHAGSKMLVFADRRQIGTIGGGEMEARVIDAAVGALATGMPRLMHFDLVDPGSGDPGVCGGTVMLYIEPLLAEASVVIVGCGHVGKAVADLAHWLGYRVIAIDDRADVATPDQMATADQVLTGAVPDLIGQVAITDQSHVVLVTRNMQVDLDALPAVLATPARSIGVMGSARRWDRTRRRLLELGVASEQLDRVRSPIGLDIAAETPEQIALSIMAEIVALPAPNH